MICSFVCVFFRKRHATLLSIGDIYTGLRESESSGGLEAGDGGAIRYAIEHRLIGAGVQLRCAAPGRTVISGPYSRAATTTKRGWWNYYVVEWLVVRRSGKDNKITK